jgi:hypothetical protein
MAAWQPYGIDGYIWEAFSLICAGMAASAAAIFEQLAYRGYTQLEYTAALQNLTYHGWLAGATDSPGSYLVTEIGQSVREAAEARTDHYFYAPWTVLNKDEQAETRRLLQQLYEQSQQQ